MSHPVRCPPFNKSILYQNPTCAQHSHKEISVSVSLILIQNHHQHPQSKKSYMFLQAMTTMVPHAKNRCKRSLFMSQSFGIDRGETGSTRGTIFVFYRYETVSFFFDFGLTANSTKLKQYHKRRRPMFHTDNGGQFLKPDAAGGLSGWMGPDAVPRRGWAGCGRDETTLAPCTLFPNAEGPIEYEGHARIPEGDRIRRVIARDPAV